MKIKIVFLKIEEGTEYEYETNSYENAVRVIKRELESEKAISPVEIKIED